MKYLYTIIITAFIYTSSYSKETEKVPSTNFDRLLVGVLENMNDGGSKPKDYQVIRVAFEKKGENWIVLDEAASPNKIDWIIAFDGKQIGQVTSMSSTGKLKYSEMGQQSLTKDSKTPKIGKPTNQFGGWEGKKLHRPLIAVSKPNFKDPDAWKPSKENKEILQLVRLEHEKKFVKPEICFDHMEKEHKYNYKNSDIHFLKSYTSNKNEQLYSVILDSKSCDTMDDDTFVDHLYLVDKNKKITFLASNMELIDAGDYDQNGKSEIVFMYSGYNTDGYRLFYEDLSKKAEFSWSYH